MTLPLNHPALPGVGQFDRRTLPGAGRFDRRALLGVGLAAIGALCLPRMAFAAAPTDRRFVFIIQRGAMDGLHMLAPLGDPAFAGLRGRLADGLAGGTRLDAMFTLHPAFQRIARMSGSGQARFVHAVASAYRDRSHFDGQNVLETGGRTAYAEQTGWMNRMLGLLPAADTALAVSPAIPMALRGPATVATYAPSRLPAASDDLLSRVSGLYAGDAQLHALWQTAVATKALAGDLGADNGATGAATGDIAAKLMLPADGARIVMIETGGWDTHSAQAARLNAQFRGLDALVGALADGLGAAWNQTMVVVATEFGRTAAVNGTQGTDHGTGTAMMLLGGAVPQGAKVVADWPGLGAAALYQGRDLRPTMATEAVIAGAVAHAFALDPARAAARLYPAQAGLRPVLT